MPVDAAHEAITEIISRDASGLKLRSRKIRVDVVAGPQSGQSFDLAGPEVRVGSARGAELLLLDGAVSRHHLTLRVERGRVRVIDAGSRNGTLLDGVSIRDAYARADSSVTAGNTQLRINLLHDEVLVPLSSRERFGALVGTSPAMRVVFTLLERAAAVDVDRAARGRDGHGQGQARARAARGERAREGALRGRRLRVGGGDADRERAVRARARRLHGRAREPRGRLRAGRRRHACSSTRSASCRSTCSRSSCERSKSAR
jgi:hypothetical protein